MGCSNSRQQSYACQTPAVGGATLLGNRRLTVNGASAAGIGGKSGANHRLTVNGAAAAGVGVGAKDEVANFTKEELNVDQADVMTLLKSTVTQGAAKCGVFSSKLDPNTKEAFKNKLVNKTGKVDIGFACKKGLKPKSPNQDAWAVVQGGDDFAMYLVCDGHGTDGHLISDLAINMIPKLILSTPNFKGNLPEVVKNTFHKMHEFIVKAGAASGFDADLSGSTATLVYHDKQLQKLTVAHVGDSGSCIGKRQDGSTLIRAKVLVEDHKPELADERARIESMGGRVEFDGYANHRVYGGNSDVPGMNMSRALGDDLGHRIAGIICEPTITEYVLEADDRFICVCSDGVWEFLKPEEVTTILESGKTVQDGCEKLAKRAWDCWIREERGEVVDDITAVLVKLPPLK